MNVELIIVELKLHIDKKYDDFVNKFCNTKQGKQKENKLESWFEGFIYTSLIGLNINSRMQYEDKYLKMRHWQNPKYRDSLNYLLMKVISQDALRNELNIFNLTQIKNDYTNINNLIHSSYNIISEFSNGGLKYLYEKYENDNSIFDEYDSLLKIYQNTMPKTPENKSINDEKFYSNLILDGEGPKVEFKSTLFVNIKNENKIDDKIILSSLKTINGFLNSHGGSLLIGVSDEKEILGLDADFSIMTKKDDKLDQFQLKLDELISKSFGNQAFSLLEITFPKVNNKQICCISVTPNKKSAVYLNKRDFYIRRTASTVKIEGPDLEKYIKSNWN